MAADLRLVFEAAEAHAHELSAERPRDRLGDARLAHAGRADEAQNGRLQFPRQFQDGEIFDDALLDLFQAVVVVVENFFDVRERSGILRLLRPRKVDEPVRIVAQHGVFGRGSGHLVHAGKLGHRLFLHLFGKVLCKQLFAQAGVLFDVVAELRVDGFELFAKVIFLL